MLIYSVRLHDHTTVLQRKLEIAIQVSVPTEECNREEQSEVQEVGTKRFQDVHLENILVEVQVQVTYYHPSAPIDVLISHPASRHA